jgi:UDP-3-O-[3-hydroxymyristoyl] glucosamine N-acyltransferase
MADPRFYRRSGPFSLEAIAQRIGAKLADGRMAGTPIHDVAALDSAGPHELSLFYDPRHTAAVQTTKAAAVVTSRRLADRVPSHVALLLVHDPRLGFAQAGYLFHPGPTLAPGIDPRANVHPDATIGAGCRIESGAVIAADVKLGADSRIGANTAISHALIGARVEIGSCCTIGGPGFGFVAGPAGLLRVPQVGRVVIEDDVRIDANCTVDRGACGDTVIGAGTAIDNLVQVGHNVRIGRYCAIAGQTGIAGSTVIGNGVMIGGQVAISDHLTIGDGARIALKSGVCRDVEPGTSVGGYPAMPVRRWHRHTAVLNRLTDQRPEAPTRPSRSASDAHANKRRARRPDLVEDGIL